MSGESCFGQTPDIAWENFQKKSGPRVKTWHAKRFSCKIDGVEVSAMYFYSSSSSPTLTKPYPMNPG